MLQLQENLIKENLLFYLAPKLHDIWSSSKKKKNKKK